MNVGPLDFTNVKVIYKIFIEREGYKLKILSGVEDWKVNLKIAEYFIETCKLNKSFLVNWEEVEENREILYERIKKDEFVISELRIDELDEDWEVDSIFFHNEEVEDEEEEIKIIERGYQINYLLRHNFDWMTYKESSSLWGDNDLDRKKGVESFIIRRMANLIVYNLEKFIMIKYDPFDRYRAYVIIRDTLNSYKKSVRLIKMDGKIINKFNKKEFLLASLDKMNWVSVIIVLDDAKKVVEHSKYIYYLKWNYTCAGNTNKINWKLKKLIENG